jgi:hypothetical protein
VPSAEVALIGNPRQYRSTYTMKRLLLTAAMVLATTGFASAETCVGSLFWGDNDSNATTV